MTCLVQGGDVITIVFVYDKSGARGDVITIVFVYDMSGTGGDVMTIVFVYDMSSVGERCHDHCLCL